MIITAKYLMLMAAGIAPFIMFFVLGRFARGSHLAPSLSRSLYCVVAVISLIAVLVFAGMSHMFHDIEWARTHSGGNLTEEDMIAQGDYPSVFATWVFFGWIPVLLGFLVSRRMTSKPKNVVEQVASSDR